MYKYYQKYISSFKGFKLFKINNILYVGSCPKDHDNIIALQSLGVRSVICLQYDDEIDVHYAYPNNWSILNIPTHDLCAVTEKNLNIACNFLELQKKNNRITFIHCRNGKGRSRTCAYYYLRKIGKNKSEAKKTSRCYNNFQLYKTESIFKRKSNI